MTFEVRLRTFIRYAKKAAVVGGNPNVLIIFGAEYFCDSKIVDGAESERV